MAVIAIGAIRDSGIIGYAQNSAETYNLKKKEDTGYVLLTQNGLQII